MKRFSMTRRHKQKQDNKQTTKRHLEGLDEGPQESSDSFPSAQELDQPHYPEQAEEGDGDASAVLCVLDSKNNRNTNK